MANLTHSIVNKVFFPVFIFGVKMPRKTRDTANGDNKRRKQDDTNKQITRPRSKFVARGLEHCEGPQTSTEQNEVICRLSLPNLYQIPQFPDHFKERYKLEKRIMCVDLTQWLLSYEPICIQEQEYILRYT